MASGSEQVIINCWSGPRCVSTSLMYSFAQRDDTEVQDEPLYAHFLSANPEVPRPYRDLVLESQNSDATQLIDSILNQPRTKPIIYLKHMAKHRAGISRDLIQNSRNFLLIRDPISVLTSFDQVVEPTLSETCYPALLELYSELRTLSKDGKTPPPVVLSSDLIKAPQATLKKLCEALQIEFDPKMLHWAAGPKPYDGVWAPWWYTTTHKTTGFTLSGVADENKKALLLKDELKPLLEECRPLWEMLRSKSLMNQSSTMLKAPTIDKQQQAAGTHSYIEDPRNANILIGIKDGVSRAFNLVWRPEAKVSVLDSGYMLGDGVWEGIRLHQGVLLFAQQHIERLYQGAKAIDMSIDLEPNELQQLVYDTVDANGMETDVHIRLMVTRGLKSTPYQNPNVTVGGVTIVIIPEYKVASSSVKEQGIRLHTSHVRRGSPDVQDPGLNSHSKLNCITACISANKAGADEALMLDPHGFVATCNSTNFFIVVSNKSTTTTTKEEQEVWTAPPKYLMNGITRQVVILLCKENGITVREVDFSLTTVYSAAEAFVTGTFAGQIPVKEVDGRHIGSSTSSRGPVTARLQELYSRLCDQQARRGRISL